MDDVLRRVVIGYLLDGRDVGWVARRLGLSVSEVEAVRGGVEYSRELEARECLLREGVEGSVRLYVDLVRGLVGLGDVDVVVRVRLLELLLRYCGFGELVRGYVLGGGVGVGVGGVYDMEGMEDGR